MSQSKSVTASDKFRVISSTEMAPQQIYFDGISSMSVGAANCKLDFHQVVGVDEGTFEEKRQVVITAVIPTAVLVELCQNVLSSLTQNAEILKNALATQESKILSAMATQTSGDAETKREKAK